MDIMMVMRLLKYNIKDKYDKLHILEYYLYPSSLADRWFNLTKSQEQSKITYNFNNHLSDNIRDLSAVLKRTCQLINQIYDKPIPIYNEFNHTNLNELHQKFEEWGDEYENKGGMWTQELSDLMMTLNDYIHKTEDVLDDTYPHAWIAMGLLVDLLPTGKHLPITEEDKFFLDSDYQWGDLYLGYNTLGKDWTEVMLNNDLEVVERGMVKPQRRFATETWCNFGPDMSAQTLYRQFVDWYKELPEDVKVKVPFNNLNELTLGRFQIGEINVNEELLGYHDNEYDWKAMHHPIKLQWNKEVFSTFRSVESIECNIIPEVKSLRKL